MMVYMKSSTAEYFCICAEFFSLLKIVNSCRNREKSYLDHIEGYITINECIFVLKQAPLVLWLRKNSPLALYLS